MKAARAVLLGLAMASTILASTAMAEPRSESIEDLFAVHLAVPAHVKDAIRPHVRVFHPYDLKPLKGVEVSLSLDDNDAVTVVTDEHGAAEAVLALPEDPGLWIDVRAVARHRGREREVMAGIYSAGWQPRAILGSDKKLYQPGQTLHVRGLWLDAEGRPLADEVVRLAVESPRGRPVFFADLVTSPFGIAATEWPIPDGAEEGKYTIDGAFGSIGDGATEVVVSRYELPLFKIAQVQPHQPYYLPGEDAEIEVIVTTAAGEPLAGAEIVLEPEYEDIEPDTARPRTLPTRSDEAGRALLRWPLEADHAELAEYGSQAWEIYPRVVARDTVSGRVVKRPVPVLVSRWPLYVDLVGAWSRPGQVFVKTSTADGAPVQGHVEIRWRPSGSEEEHEIARLRTDRYGLARLETTRITQEVKGGDWVLRVRDNAGRSGKAELRVHQGVSTRIFIDSPQTLHSKEEPLTVTLQPSQPMEDVVVQVLNDGRLLRERRFPRVEPSPPTPVVFEAGDDFAGRIDVVAYSVSAEYEDGSPTGQRSVLYPHGDRLELGMTARRTRYQPGEPAQLDVHSSVPAVLGVSVTDRSLEALRERHGFDRRPALFPDPAWEEEHAGWTATRLLESAELPEDPDLLAELLMRGDNAHVTTRFSTPLGEERTEYASFFEAQFQDPAFEKAFSFPELTLPKGQISQKVTLTEAGFDAMVDPWGTPYRASVFALGKWMSFGVYSAGRDRTWNSIDDFSAWSRTKSYAYPAAKLAEEQVRLWYLRTGRFPREAQALGREVERSNPEWTHLRHPWGGGFQIGIPAPEGRNFELEILASDTGIGTRHVAWHQSLELTKVLRSTLWAALRDHWDRHQAFPATDKAMRLALRQIDQDPDSWQDVAGDPLFFERTERSDFIDRLVVEPDGQRRLEPVETSSARYVLWSTGPDRLRGTEDDLRHGDLNAPTPPSWGESRLEGRSGRLSGRVYGEDGRRVRTEVVILDAEGRQLAAVHSDWDGRFDLVLPAGLYTVRVELEGFLAETARVEIHPSRGTGLDVVLERDPEATGILARTVSAGMSSGTASPVGAARIRRDFRETLLWLPELETDETGHAEITFDLDDSITTWRVAALASTRDGLLATATQELVATLPFRAELDLPKVVTAGDEISVPVYLHNRTQKAREVEVRAERRSSTSPAQLRSVSLDAGDVRRLDFEQVFGQVGEAVLTVTSRSESEADGVERRTHVRPDGRKVVESQARLLDRVQDLRIEVPANVLPDTGRLELRVMDRLSDHLTAAVEALAGRPVGCAEQTLSTAWANALWWRFMDATGELDAEKLRRARQLVELGRDALAPLQDNEGGVAYWPGGQADVALTAYAFEYLDEIRGLVPVEAELPEDLADWLRATQDKDGAWRHRRPQWAQAAEPAAAGPLDLRITAWIARILATGEHFEAARRALAFLDEHRLANDPYTLANVVLARQALAESRGDATPSEERTRLVALARDLGGASYWDLESNTPFHGWGHGGRVETTALAVRALAATPTVALERGIAFLLLHKDEAGAWASTQATVQAMRTLVDVLPSGPTSSTPLLAQLGGTDIALEPGEPLDLPLAPGTHRLRVEPSGASARRFMEVRVRYHVPWEESESVASPEDLFFKVRCDPRDGLGIGRSVDCSVEAGRRRFRGYGMLIAEIGLPPGAEVERGRLDEAVAEGNIQRYEVRPDRVVTYLWPQPGGVRFAVRWYPRLEMKARSAPSSLYDYYNPESKLVLAPENYHVE